MDDAKNYNDIVNSLTSQDVAELAHKIKNGESFEIVFKPKK